MEEAYFPLFINMNHRKVLIVGAGAIGARRAGVLAEFGAEVTVVAPEGVPGMERLTEAAAKKAPEMQEATGAAAKEGPGMQEATEAAAGNIRWLRRSFREEDICRAGRMSQSGIRPDFVIAATDDDELNSRIVKLCREAGIPVNHAGDKSQCDFFFPGIAREGNLVAGVTASGADHGLTRRAAAQLRQWLGRFCAEERENQ